MSEMSREQIQDINELLSEMDREGDGWYGRAEEAIKFLQQRLDASEKERHSLQIMKVQALDGEKKAYAQLAEVTQERDTWMAAADTSAGQGLFWCNRVTELETQLAASEGRCKALEEAAEISKHNAVTLSELLQPKDDAITELRQALLRICEAARYSGDMRFRSLVLDVAQQALRQG